MPKAAQTVDEFCVDNNICRATFYVLRKAGKGPRIMKIGSRTLISAEAAADWRLQMEAETARRAEVERVATDDKSRRADSSQP